MRITQVITTLGTGGAETLIVGLSSELIQRGHDVRILTLATRDGLPLRAAHEAGIQVSSLNRNLRDPRMILDVRNELKNSDVVHAHLFPTLYVLGFARINVPSVYTEHSTNNKRRGMASLRAAERKCYSSYSCITTISEGAKESLAEHFSRISLNRNIEVVRNGISPAFFQGSPIARRDMDDTFRLMSVGRLDSRKNFGDAIDALAMVTNASLDIFGEGPLAIELQQHIVRRNLEDRVKLHGARKDIRELMDNHDALLSTSRFEGFGIAAAEAMARGLPVIAPNLPGLREVVRHRYTGILYEPGSNSPQQIASAIKLLRDNSPMRYNMGEAGIRESKQFTMTQAAIGYEAIYSDLVNAHGID